MESIQAALKDFSVRTYGSDREVFVYYTIPGLGTVTRLYLNKGIKVKQKGIINFEDLKNSEIEVIIKYIEECKKNVSTIKKILDNSNIPDVKRYFVFFHSDSFKKLEFIIQFEPRNNVSFESVNKFLRNKFKKLGFKTSQDPIDSGQFFISCFQRRYEKLSFINKIFYDLKHLFL
jgi:hypothetical protein